MRISLNHWKPWKSWFFKNRKGRHSYFVWTSMGLPWSHVNYADFMGFTCIQLCFSSPPIQYKHGNFSKPCTKHPHNLTWSHRTHGGFAFSCAYSYDFDRKSQFAKLRYPNAWLFIETSFTQININMKISQNLAPNTPTTWHEVIGLMGDSQFSCVYSFDFQWKLWICKLFLHQPTYNHQPPSQVSSRTWTG